MATEWQWNCSCGTCWKFTLWNLLEIHLLVVGKAIHKEVPCREAGLWMLLTVLLRECLTGEAALAVGAGSWRSCARCRNLCRGAPWNRRGKALPRAVSLQCSLIMLNIVTVGRGNIFKGSSLCLQLGRQYLDNWLIQRIISISKFYASFAAALPKSIL